MKARFRIIYSEEANEFLLSLPKNVKRKILFNIAKAKYVIDPDIFKKLTNTDIWEFRTRYRNIQYRLLAFWDNTNNIDTLVIATHGFIKKSQKTPYKEIAKAIQIRRNYYRAL